MTDKTNDDTTSSAVATLGGGCFWCLEAVFTRLRGVTRVQSGYAGGRVKNPTYREVCSGLTGHAEVVQVHYDPTAITYRELLEVFFGTHDPTTPDRQGNDVGPQYRSIILTHDDAQRLEAEKLVAELQREGTFESPIVTAIEPLTAFYEAEQEHKDYYARNPDQGYCRAVVAPKVAKLRQKFAGKLRAGA